MSPTLASASIVPSAATVTGPCRSPECVRRKVNASTTVRLTGEFGRFSGRVTGWEGDSLVAFAVDPDWGGSVPAAPIAWSQLASVDKRVNKSATGAVFGALSLGLVSALFAVTVASATNESTIASGSDAQKDKINKAALTGGLVGGAVGAAVGAYIGSSSYRWSIVYRR